MIGLLILVSLRLQNSRVGRAWRSLREDPLAAEVMGMPINWLKLTAFATGAGTAALTGTLATALSASVFPLNFSPTVLITIYAMVILGGAGSLTGVVLGAVLLNISLEVLRTPDHARWVFYAVILGALIAKIRPWRLLAAVLGGLVVIAVALVS